MFYAPPPKQATTIRDGPLFPTKKQQESRQVYSCHVKVTFYNEDGYPKPGDGQPQSSSLPPSQKATTRSNYRRQHRKRKKGYRCRYPINKGPFFTLQPKEKRGLCSSLRTIIPGQSDGSKLAAGVMSRISKYTCKFRLLNLYLTHLSISLRHLRVPWRISPKRKVQVQG